MAVQRRALAIHALKLQGIRSFRDLDRSFAELDVSPRRRVIFLGKNGTGKSTLLRSIAIGLADRIDASFLIANSFGSLISRDERRARISLELNEFVPPFGPSFSLDKYLLRRNGKEGLELQLPDDEVASAGDVGPRMYQDHDDRQPDEHGTFVFGVGAGRSVAAESGDTGNPYRMSDAVATLFDYNRPLLNSELTLRRMKDFLGSKRYTSAMQGIKRVLGLETGDNISFRPGGGVSIDSRTLGRKCPLESLADGYRLTLAWLLSLYGWAMRAEAIDEEGHISGILLIDEIEQHLHPSLQAEILPRLTELLPKMQIFATTHSPLVVLDAKPEEVVVLRREGETVVAEPHIPDFRGYSAEDVLTDPRLFDTPEVYGSEKRQVLEQYRELSAIPPSRRSARQSTELRRLAIELHGQPEPSSRESEVVRELRELVAKGRL